VQLLNLFQKHAKWRLFKPVLDWRHIFRGFAYECRVGAPSMDIDTEEYIQRIQALNAIKDR
jgi:hypothetical protein